MSERDDPKLQQWGERVAAELRATEATDAVTRARLAAARARAIEAARRPAPARTVWVLSAALAASIAAAVLLPRPEPAAVTPAVAAHEALEVLTDEQDPEFYRDLDLYLWLDAGSADA